jgi:hypothetical protein
VRQRNGTLAQVFGLTGSSCRRPAGKIESSDNVLVYAPAGRVACLFVWYQIMMDSRTGKQAGRRAERGGGLCLIKGRVLGPSQGQGTLLCARRSTAAPVGIGSAAANRARAPAPEMGSSRARRPASSSGLIRRPCAQCTARRTGQSYASLGGNCNFWRARCPILPAASTRPRQTSS